MVDDPEVPQPLDYQAPQRPAKLIRWWWVGAVTLVFLLFFNQILIPSRGQSRDFVNRVRSLDNLRQIGQAILLYTDENRGVLPTSLSTLLLTEDITSIVFVSPFSNDVPATGPTTQSTAANVLAGGHCSYVYLGAGLNRSSVGPDTVIAYEPAPNPTQTFNILFGDGHVACCGPGWWKTFHEQLAARPPASTMPIRLAQSG